jgi:predicted site-specific integrase-resolvase
MWVKSNNMGIQPGPGENAVAKVRSDVEAQVARADKWSIDPLQCVVVEGQSIIDKKRPTETKRLMD